MRWTLLIAMVAGCTDGAATGPSPLLKCPSDTCRVSDALVIAAEIVPSATSASGPQLLPSQEIGELSLDAANSRFTIALEAPITLSGTVKTSGMRPQAVAGTVLATRPSRIAGRPDVSYQAKVDPDKGTYSLLVSPTHPGEIYTLRVLPAATANSPPEAFLVEATADRTLDIQLSDSSKLLQIHGTITDALLMPLPGLQLQAVDPVTRATLSTVAATDSSGNFVVKLAPPPTPVGSTVAPAAVTEVRLVATAPTQGTATPTLEMPVDVTHAGAANSLTINLMLPPLPAPTQLVYRVLGVGSSGAQTPVVAAHCQFTADVSDVGSNIVATYQVSAETDADGKATVTLIPSASDTRNYQVTVSPPSSSDFQATATSVSVGPTGGYAAPIVLAQRAQVTGRVLGPDQAPVKNLMIIPTPATVAAALGSSSNSLQPKLPSALSDGEGRFVLRLDAGGYDFGLIPPATTSLPRQWVDGQVIATDVVLQDVLMPAGALVHGLVTDAAGQPLSGADVRLYSLVQNNAACPMSDYTCLAPPRIIAQGTSIADGSVPVLLPAAAPSH